MCFPPVVNIFCSELFGYFNQKGIADSHFYVRKDGTVEQYVDTAYQAYADLQGNDATISIETQGGLHNTQSEKWTPAQVESLAQIYAWAVKTHGIPLKIAKDSIPTGTSSHGLSWHRLGIDGNFPGGILHGRKPGGMHYSRSRGKVCPGNAKIRQVPDVFARAQQILNGTPAGGTTPPTTKKDWFDMATKKDLEDAVWAVLNRQISVGGDTAKRHGKTAPLYALIRDGAYALDEIRDTPRRVWMYEVKVGGATKAAIGSDKTNAISALRYAAAAIFDSRPRFASILNRLKG